jgi:hypothetical protein
VKKFTLILSVMVVFSSSLLFAEVFSYENGMHIVLGQGWDPFNPNRSKADRGYFESEVQAGNYIAEDSFSQRFSDSFSEFSQTVNLRTSINASGSLGLVSMASQIDHSSQRRMFQDSRYVVWIVSGTRRYESVYASNIALTDKGNQLLSESIEANDPDAFYRFAGRSIVTSITKESNISLVYIFKTSNSEAASEVRSAISSSANYVAGSASVDVNMMETITEIDNSVELSVEIYQSGVQDNIQVLNEIIAYEPGNISRVREQLLAALSAISWENSPITEFTAAPVNDFFNISDDERWGDVAHIYDDIYRIRHLIGRCATRYFDLQNLLRKVDNFEVELRDDDARGEIESEMRILEETVQELVVIGNQYLDGELEELNIPEVQLNNDFLKWINPDYALFMNWDYEIINSTYSKNSERIDATAIMWPLIILKNIEYIQSVELIQGMNRVVYLDGDSIESHMVDGVFSFKELFTQYVHERWYCWGGQKTVCTNTANNHAAVANRLRNRAPVITYWFGVTDINGNSFMYPVKSLQEITFN